MDPTELEAGETSISSFSRVSIEEASALVWFTLLFEIFLLIAANSSCCNPSGLSNELPKIPSAGLGVSGTFVEVLNVVVMNSGSSSSSRIVVSSFLMVVITI